MLQKLSIALCIFTIIFSGCQKDVDKHTAASASVNNSNATKHGMVDSTGRWFGTSLGFLEDPDKPAFLKFYRNKTAIC
jgi:hypothetical protein